MDVYTQRRLIVAFALVVILGGLLFLIVRWVMPESAAVEQFRVNTIAFASNVDDNFEYGPKEVFKIGDTLWVYAELYDYPDYVYPEGYYVLLSMDVETYDSSGNLVPDFTGNLLNIADYMSEQQVLYLASSFTTVNLTEGTYNMKFRFTDLMNYTELTAEKQFRMIK